MKRNIQNLAKVVPVDANVLNVKAGLATKLVCKIF